MYFFTELALTLNEAEEGVAPTDSRQRPDQRLMEAGRWDEANAEKQRLEEKQRSVRREREREAATQRTANQPEEGEGERPFYKNKIFIFNLIKAGIAAAVTEGVARGDSGSG